MKTIRILQYACLIILAAYANSCGSNSSNNKTEEINNTDKPWNITVMLDLSDRLIKGKGEPQMLRDTSIIAGVAKMFTDNVVLHKIVPCKDRFQVMFYPTEGIDNASALSDSLLFDLSTVSPKAKKFVLMNMPKKIRDNVSLLYDKTIEKKNWVGSDIYGFFKDRIKISTIKKDYRNVLIILTDGYIYHKESAASIGNEFTYILSSNINQKGLKLKNCDCNLNELEVLFLEINPVKPDHMDKMKAVIGDWLTEMGCRHFDFIKTDVSANITPALKNFFDEKKAQE